MALLFPWIPWEKARSDQFAFSSWLGLRFLPIAGDVCLSDHFRAVQAGRRAVGEDSENQEEISPKGFFVVPPSTLSRCPYLA